MHFNTKNTLKNNHNYTLKHALSFIVKSELWCRKSSLKKKEIKTIFYGNFGIESKRIAYF
jgi:hypothetical protein